MNESEHDGEKCQTLEDYHAASRPGGDQWNFVKARLHSEEVLVFLVHRAEEAIDWRDLATALRLRCDMAVWCVPRETWTAFGHWLLERFPVEEWTPDLGRAEWAKWIESDDVTVQLQR